MKENQHTLAAVWASSIAQVHCRMVFCIHSSQISQRIVIFDCY